MPSIIAECPLYKDAEFMKAGSLGFKCTLGNSYPKEVTCELEEWLCTLTCDCSTACN